MKTNAEIHESIVSNFRGRVQRRAVRDLLNGYEVRPLYADLAGKAKKYGGSYVRSHGSMCEKLASM